HSVRTYGGRQGFHGVLEVESLADQLNQIVRLAQGRGGDELRSRDDRIAQRAADHQTTTELLRALGPNQKRDVPARLSESGAEITADRSGSDNENPHAHPARWMAYLMGILAEIRAHWRRTFAVRSCGPGPERNKDPKQK